MSDASSTRPAFFDALSRAYSLRGKSVVLLTGDTLDLFWSEKAKSFLPLEQALYQELAGKFLMLRMDAANGIDFFDEKDKRETLRVCGRADSLATRDEQRLGDVDGMIERNRHQPLPTLVLLKGVVDAATRAQFASDVTPVKPICVLVRFAAALFPSGDFDRLSEIDRQRLVTFLDWIGSPVFVQSKHLIILVSDTRSELNNRIMSLPSSQNIEIDLPNLLERRRYAARFIEQCPEVKLEQGFEGFASDTAGLKLTSMQDLLEGARRGGSPVARKEVLAEVNGLLEATLGDIIRVKIPSHSSADVVGYAPVKRALTDLFARCGDVETAASGLLLSGPNGVGKTWIMEAFAAESGRCVIELAGLRGMYFGETDKLWEMLRWNLRTYGKVLILVDEAHTAFGSVHKSDTHETEKRLAGNIIKMMGDPAFLGKVLWGLMTSRPDELDPDVKRRAPSQIPIFDLEGEERRGFIGEMFSRKGIRLSDAELAEVFDRTGHYSPSDLANLIRQVKASKGAVGEVLRKWRASTAIIAQRRFQSLVAAQHCSYPELLPRWLADMSPDEIAAEAEGMKLSLGL